MFNRGLPRPREAGDWGLIVLWIPARMPGFNEILDARMIRGKGAKSTYQWNAYSQMKKRWAGNIRILCWHRRLEFIERGFFTYLFVEPNRKRDLSNITAGGIKLIEDALIEAKILENDNWEHVRDIRPYVELRDFEGVLVVCHETRVLERAEMIELMEKEYAREKREKWTRTHTLRHPEVRGPDRGTAAQRPGAGGELPGQPTLGGGADGKDGAAPGEVI